MDKFKQGESALKSSDLPKTFEQAVAEVIQVALKEIEQQRVEKGLFYHTVTHAKAVRRRARVIFQAISPCISKENDEELTPDRLKQLPHLLDLSAICHDLVQDFLPQSRLQLPRQREAGISEAASIKKVFDIIEVLNEQHLQANKLPLFNQWHKQNIQEMIEATICLPDPGSGELYQPALYDDQKTVSIAGRIIALADLGCLGMEGIGAYRQEGQWIVLEENPHIIPNLINKNPELLEKTRARLLNRCNFQLSFAKSRLSRFSQEVAGLPESAIEILRSKIFKYLKPGTIAELEKITPKNPDTSLADLVDFFGLGYWWEQENSNSIIGDGA